LSEYAVYPFRPGLFWTDVGLSVLYDTNFELTQVPLEGPGLLADVRAHLRTSSGLPFARVEYRGQLRQFKASERWNRDSHMVQTVLERRLGPLGMEGIGVWQTSSQTEDRELADVYSVSPRVTLRARSMRVRAFGRYWTRQFRFDQEREETIRTVGGDLGWRIFRVTDWNVGFRREEAESDRPSWRFESESVSAYCRIQLGRHTALTVEASRSERSYPERLLESEGKAMPVEELRLAHAAYLQLGPWLGPQLRLGYEYELRTSNDPQRGLDAHRASLALRVPVVNWDRQPRSSP